MDFLKTTLGTLSGVPDHSILQCSGNITNLDPLLESANRPVHSLAGAGPFVCLRHNAGVFAFSFLIYLTLMVHPAHEGLPLSQIKYNEVYYTI